MGIVDRILGKERVRVEKAQLVNEQIGGFSSYAGYAYANDIYRGAVDAIARNAGKLKGSHVIKYEDHSRVEGDCKINRILQVKPNPYMNAYDCLYKIVTHLYLYNNSFAYIERDGKGRFSGIYPVSARHVDILTDPQGGMYCRFTFKSGAVYTFRYSDVLHLRRFFNDDDILGDSNDALNPAIELAQTQNDGIINGIRSGANIRGILKFTQIMSAEKLKAEKEAFISDYLRVSNDGGIVAADQKMDYIPIESKPVILNADQTKEIKSKIYNYLGVTEAIVNSSYTEDQFAAFYESTIEPIALALGLEFTNKVFNDREQAFGNQIMFESGRLQFTSNATKVNLIKELMPYGLLSINQALEILNLPAVKDGDKRLQTLNVIDASRAADYQAARAGVQVREGDEGDNEEE